MKKTIFKGKNIISKCLSDASELREASALSELGICRPVVQYHIHFAMNLDMHQDYVELYFEDNDVYPNGFNNVYLNRHSCMVRHM